MSELIDLDVARSYAKERWPSPVVRIPIEALLDDCPRAAETVRHGYWMDKGSLSCRCSECGCKHTKESAFCPNCGAKMDLK